MHISLHRWASLNINPSKLSPSKGAFKKYKPRGLFLELIFTVLGKQNLLFPKEPVILKVFDITNVVVSNFFCLFSWKSEGWENEFTLCPILISGTIQ